ncbi:MAG TPA: glycosyltransferase [Jatrophihabitans sp.]
MTAVVTVLMATYNGRDWLPEQAASILDQEGVQVRLVVSDDGSDDGTWEWLQELAAGDARVRLLPRGERLGTAAANFYRLIAEHVEDDGGYVALSDQDDRWLPGKLAAQTALLDAGRYDGVSSDVIAFDESGRRQLLRKSNPQRRYDYLFESGGPGSTFVLTPRLVRLVQEQLAQPGGGARSVEAHDWLIYALCRAAGWRWLIEDRSWVDYRQHSDNELGANKGLRSALWRLRKIKQGWHRQQVLTLTDLAIGLASDPARSELEQLRTALCDKGIHGRLQLIKGSAELRRHPRDRAVLAALIAAGLW